MDEVEFRQIAGSLVQQVIFPPNCASLGREGFSYNLSEYAQQLLQQLPQHAGHNV